MTPFVEAALPPEYLDVRAMMNTFKVDLQTATGYVEQMSREKYYVNDIYQVHVSNVHKRPDFPDIIHLSIKRRDKEPVRDWRDMQAIKNIFVGAENEAIELYPAESRLVDMANQYHCWVFANKEVRLPVPYVLEEIMSKTGPKVKPVQDRFWPKVKVLEVDDCWEWQGATNGREYGVLARAGDSSGVSSYYAHRLSYAIANGVEYEDIPSDLEVMHSCDNRKCCNPSHLSLGTSKDNKADAIAKKRMFWQKAKRSSTGQFEQLASQEGD